jgi:hypothetical protein
MDSKRRAKRKSHSSTQTSAPKNAGEYPLKVDPPGNSLYAELAGEGPGAETNQGSEDLWMPSQPSDGSDDAPTVIRTNRDLDAKD